jgi:uncharacterized protein (TIRG00374 family)
MNTALMSRRSLVWRWLPPAALLGLVMLFANALPWATNLTSMRGTSLPLVGLAVCSTLLAIAARALLFWRLLRQHGATSLGLAARATYTAVALNSILVGQAGEAGRVLLVVKESQHRSAQVIATVVFEHAMVSAIYLALLVSAGALLPMPDALARWRLGALLALVTLGCMLLFLGHARGTDRPGRGRSFGPLRQLTRGVGAFLGTLRSLAAGGNIASGLLLAVAHWALQLLAFFATSAALGHPMPAAAIVVAFLAVSASGSVRLTPGNVGVTQVVFAGAVGVFGVPLQEAVAVAMLWQIVQTVPTVIVALALAPRSLAMLRPARHQLAA